VLGCGVGRFGGVVTDDGDDEADGVDEAEVVEVGVVDGPGVDVADDADGFVGGSPVAEVVGVVADVSGSVVTLLGTCRWTSVRGTQVYEGSGTKPGGTTSAAGICEGADSSG